MGGGGGDLPCWPLADDENKLSVLIVHKIEKASSAG